MPRYKVECQGCNAEWFVVKRRKLDAREKRQLRWRSRCRPCGVELSAPTMFERTGKIFYSDRHCKQFDELVTALRLGEMRHTFGGKQTYEQIQREQHKKDLYSLATDTYGRKHTKELMWKCAARVEAFKAAGLDLESFKPSQVPLKDEQVREWANWKFCGACWNYRHSNCKGNGCQCCCKVKGKAQLREIAETLDILENNYSLGIGEQVTALYAKTEDNHAN